MFCVEEVDSETLKNFIGYAVTKSCKTERNMDLLIFLKDLFLFLDYI